MTSNLDGRIGEQHAAYRKGLVLGLTMAEVGILIIFVLLLLIAFDYLRRAEVVSRFANKTAVEPARLQELERAETSLHEIGEVLGIESAELPDDFARLVRALEAVARSPGGESALAEAKEVIGEMERAAERVASAAEKLEAGQGEQVADELESLSYRIENQDGLLTRYESQLARLGLGQGADRRACWVNATGEIDFLYDVVLTSAGIRMRERVYPERAAERSRWPMAEVDPAETLTASEFVHRTKPLSDFAKREKCVHYVVIYDQTAANEKDKFIDLMRRVEGHFYKSFPPNAVAPF